MRAEAVGLHANRVRPGTHIGQVVGAVALGRDETRGALLLVGDFDLGAGNDGSGVIGDRSENRAQRLGGSANHEWPYKEGRER